MGNEPSISSGFPNLIYQSFKTPKFVHIFLEFTCFNNEKPNAKKKIVHTYPKFTYFDIEKPKTLKLCKPVLSLLA